MRAWQRFLRVFLALCLGATTQARADKIFISAASDLSFCIEELNRAFVETHPQTRIQVATGSSGNFFAQIKNGAPYDLFLSADMTYARELIKAGLAERWSLTPYAVGRIVLWTMKTNLNLTADLSVVREPGIRKIAIANPEHAPYGRAARAALQHYKLWEAVQPRLVLGENISQAAQFVQTGNADLGIVALSVVLSPRLAGQGRYLEIPLESYPALEQGAVITRKGAAKPGARSYLEFLVSADARAILNRFGFRLPELAK